MARHHAAALAAALLALVGSALAQTPPGECVGDLMIHVDHDNAVVTLSWTPIASAQSHVVERTLDGGDPEPIAVLGADASSYVDSPAPDGIVEYRVAANGAPGPECPAVSAHIGGGFPPPDEVFCVGGVVGEALAGGAIRLSWPGIPGVTNYEVLRAEGDGRLVPHRVIGDGSTSIVDTSTTPGVAYTYAVAANGLPGPGQRCQEVTVVAVPEFAHVAAVAAALVGSLVGLVALRRR